MPLVRRETERKGRERWREEDNSFACLYLIGAKLDIAVRF